MSTNPNFHKLRELIIQEHGVLNSLWMNLIHTQFANVELLKEFKKLLELHTANEENLLFAEMLKHKELNEGGPFCVLYYDDHMCHRPKDRFYNLFKQDVPQRESLDLFAKNKSPLDIPIEDHSVLITLVDRLILQNYPKELESELISSLQNIMHKHHEKEETCFLKMCEAVLKDSSVEMILNNWSHFTS